MHATPQIREIISALKGQLLEKLESTPWIQGSGKALNLSKSFSSPSPKPAPPPTPLARLQVKNSLPKKNLPSEPSLRKLSQEEEEKEQRKEQKELQEKKDLSYQGQLKELQSLFPQENFLLHPPKDTIAQKQASLWKTYRSPEIFLCFRKEVLAHPFLLELQKALEYLFSPAALYPSEEMTSFTLSPDFSSAKLLLIEEGSILPKDISLPHIPLSTPEKYVAHPLLKAKLWKKLKRQLL